MTILPYPNGTLSNNGGSVVVNTNGSVSIVPAGGLPLYAGTIIQLEAQETVKPIQLQGVTGVGGRRLSIQAGDPNGSAEVQLVPGASLNPAANLMSQVQWFNAVGTNYERLDISAVNNQYIMDSTYNGTGTPRNIYFQMGGSVGNAITGQNALAIYADGSVDLNGANYTSQGKTWGVSRTRIADWTNTGISALIIDTRTTTPASVTTDSSYIELRRGGTRKWSYGLNYAGGNADNFDFWNTALRLSLSATGNLFVGNTSSAPATPTGGGQLYIVAGALTYKGSSGTVTTVAPA